MEESIFTKIINGEIPCHKVYEDDKTFVFMDIQPIQPGQVVVVPKTQAPVVWDLTDEDYTALMATVQKVGKKLRIVFSDKELVAVNIEGLGVRNHAHVKVYPFTTAAEYHHNPENDSEPASEYLAEIAEKLRAA